MVDYYRLTKRDIGEYTIPDFIRLLRTESYKELDWNVSLALYSCLAHYRYKYILYHKTRYITENHYRMQLREFNGNTSEVLVYTYESSAKYPVHRLYDEEYENFFLYFAKHNAPYALKMWEEDYTRVVDNTVIYTLTPREEFIRHQYLLSEVSYWYLGKRLTDGKEFICQTILDSLDELESEVEKGTLEEQYHHDIYYEVLEDVDKYQFFRIKF